MASQTIPLTRLRPAASASVPTLRSSSLNPADGNGESEEATMRAPQEPALEPVSRKKQASVLLSAFLTISLTIGYNQCYGVFQEYYLSTSQDLLSPAPAAQANPPTALLAFVGTLGAGLTWAGSIFVNPLIARIETGAWASRRGVLGRLTPRWVTVTGVLLMALGFLLASLASRIWHLLLAQGLLYGIGSSLLYFPLLSPAPEYFTTHRATALGMILSGGGVGGLVLSPAVRALLSSVGARWTLRIYALFILVVGIPVACAVPRSRFPSVPSEENSGNSEDARPTPQQRRSTHISKALAATPTFLFSAVAAFMQSAGASLPLSFIPSYSVALGLGASTGATLLAASNAINAASRIATGYAGDRLGRQNTLVLTVIIATASVFAFWLGSVVQASPDDGASLLASAAGSRWAAFIVIYSISAGGYYALFPATIAEVFGIRQYAAVNGFIYFIRGLGTMFGSPIGGQLLVGQQSGPAEYARIVYWDGALLLVASLCVAGVRWADAQGKGWKWVA